MVRFFAVAFAAASLAACTTGPTPYQSGVADGYGYEETAIESDRYLVSFRGNSLTERENVETFLIYRAAELTLEQGRDHFLVVRRDTESDRRTVTTGAPFTSRYGMRYRYFHPAYGWYGWRDPFWDEEYRTRESPAMKPRLKWFCATAPRRTIRPPSTRATSSRPWARR